jgi:hypothetical protein
VRAATLLFLLPALSPLTADDLKTLYISHRWFDLRDALRGTSAPLLYRGAAASAFNQTKKAEKLLLSATRRASNSEAAFEAHKLLTDLYRRTGRFPEALEQMKEVLRIRPDYPGLQNALAALEAFRQDGEQSVTRRHPSRLRYKMAGNNLVIPISVNGRPANYILDTDFGISAMSESEAQRLGLVVREVNAVASGNPAVGSVPIRTTVAPEIVIGNIHVRNVSFIVNTDSGQPWADLPAGERGLIGLPVILAMETLRWTKDGEIEIGAQLSPRDIARANLCFDAMDPVNRVGFGLDQLDMTLDTGEENSQIWNRFAVDYAALVKDRGKKSSDTVTEVGGSKDFETVTLPELTLRVGGLDTVLRPATVFPKPIGRDRLHGRIGMDLILQSRRVTIDFRSMTLTLE